MFVVNVASTAYYSRDDLPTEDACDFAVLELCAVPAGKQLPDGLSMETTTSRVEAMFSKTLWDEVNPMYEDDKSKQLGKLAMIGHPRGSFKHLSFADAVPITDHTQFTRSYTPPTCSRPGSSGSPVFGYCLNDAFDPTFVFVLHHRGPDDESQGVNILKVLKSIGNQL
jgi:hypothetical protein